MLKERQEGQCEHIEKLERAKQSLENRAETRRLHLGIAVAALVTTLLMAAVSLIVSLIEKKP